MLPNILVGAPFILVIARFIVLVTARFIILVTARSIILVTALLDIRAGAHFVFLVTAPFICAFCYHRLYASTIWDRIWVMSRPLTV